MSLMQNIPFSAPTSRGAVAIEALPEPGCRWTGAKKAIVAAAVLEGVISVAEACARYELSLEELGTWQRAYCRSGWRGLQAKRLRKNRKVLAAPL